MEKITQQNGTGQVFRKSAIPKVDCADTWHSADVLVKVRIRIRVRASPTVRLRVCGNSRLSE